MRVVCWMCADQQTHLLDGLAERVQLLSFPSEIRVQQIYLGNYLHAHSEDVIAHLGITHILNATTQHENKFVLPLTHTATATPDPCPRRGMFTRLLTFTRTLVLHLNPIFYKGFQQKLHTAR